MSVEASAQRQAVLDAIAMELTAFELGHPVRVAVDGITAVGKTTFANELADAVHASGRDCLRVSMDGFHHPRATRYRQGRESADGYYEDAYDFDALRRELLDPLGAAGNRSYRTAVIDLATDTPVAPPTETAIESLVLIVDGSFLQRNELDGAWDRVLYLRAPFDSARDRGAARDAVQLGSEAEAQRIFRTRYHAAQHRYLAEVDPEHRADVVVEHDDIQRPIIRTHRPARRSTAALRVAEAQTFFGPRATDWNERFAEDGPAFTTAIAELGLGAGMTVLDLGCGAGRALEEMVNTVGPSGRVIGLDVTIEMLHAARAAVAPAHLVLADAGLLPLADRTCDAVFAAGLVSHLHNPVLGLVDTARVARDGARHAVFHPVGRAALARKHHRELRRDDPLDPANLPALLAASGWDLQSVDDGPDRYLALASRTP